MDGGRRMAAPFRFRQTGLSGSGSRRGHTAPPGPATGEGARMINFEVDDTRLTGVIGG